MRNHSYFIHCLKLLSPTHSVFSENIFGHKTYIWRVGGGEGGTQDRMSSPVANFESDLLPHRQHKVEIAGNQPDANFMKANNMHSASLSQDLMLD